MDANITQKETRNCVVPSRNILCIKFLERASWEALTRSLCLTDLRKNAILRQAPNDNVYMLISLTISYWISFRKISKVVVWPFSLKPEGSFISYIKRYIFMFMLII